MALTHPRTPKSCRFGYAKLQENGGEGKVARAFRESILYSKAVPVPCDAVVLLGAGCLSERQCEVEQVDTRSHKSGAVLRLNGEKLVSHHMWLVGQIVCLLASLC